MHKPPLHPLSLSIVLPCWNEEDNVARTVRAAADVGSRVASDLEIVVVDDGSTDRTAEIVRELAREIAGLRLVQNETNQGYGGALRRGFLEATRDWVFYTDGDGQFDLGELPAFLASLRRFDVVSGYRVGRKDGLFRAVNGAAWTALVNVLLGVALRDVNCAYKVFPRALFERIEMRSRGALIDAEVMAEARRLGLRVGEVPVRHLARASGQQSGGKPRVIARAAVELAALLRRRGGPQWQTRLRPVRLAS